MAALSRLQYRDLTVGGDAQYYGGWGGNGGNGLTDIDKLGCQRSPKKLSQPPQPQEYEGKIHIQK